MHCICVKCVLSNNCILKIKKKLCLLNLHFTNFSNITFWSFLKLNVKTNILLCYTTAQLRALYLGDNDFETIPSGIGEFKNLQVVCIIWWFVKKMSTICYAAATASASIFYKFTRMQLFLKNDFKLCTIVWYKQFSHPAVKALQEQLSIIIIMIGLNNH